MRAAAAHLPDVPWRCVGYPPTLLQYGVAMRLYVSSSSYVSASAVVICGHLERAVDRRRSKYICIGVSPWIAQLLFAQGSGETPSAGPPASITCVSCLQEWTIGRAGAWMRGIQRSAFSGGTRVRISRWLDGGHRRPVRRQRWHCGAAALGLRSAYSACLCLRPRFPRPSAQRRRQELWWCMRTRAHAYTHTHTRTRIHALGTPDTHSPSHAATFTRSRNTGPAKRAQCTSNLASLLLHCPHRGRSKTQTSRAARRRNRCPAARSNAAMRGRSSMQGRGPVRCACMHTGTSRRGMLRA